MKASDIFKHPWVKFFEPEPVLEGKENTDPNRDEGSTTIRCDFDNNSLFDSVIMKVQKKGRNKGVKLPHDMEELNKSLIREELNFLVKPHIDRPTKERRCSSIHFNALSKNSSLKDIIEMSKEIEEVSNSIDRINNKNNFDIKEEANSSFITDDSARNSRDFCEIQREKAPLIITTNDTIAITKSPNVPKLLVGKEIKPSLKKKFSFKDEHFLSNSSKVVKDRQIEKIDTTDKFTITNKRREEQKPKEESKSLWSNFIDMFRCGQPQN